MQLNQGSENCLLRQLETELTETALQVASRYSVQRPAPDQKLDFREALGRVVRKRKRVLGEREVQAGEDEAWRETLVAEAADAVYRVALSWGFVGSFLDLELDLWQSLSQAIGRSPLAPRVFRPL